LARPIRSAVAFGFAALILLTLVGCQGGGIPTTTVASDVPIQSALAPTTTIEPSPAAAFSPMPLLPAVCRRESADLSAMEIAFSADRDGDNDIFAIRADGSGLRQIVDSDENDYFPAWSPTGDRLFYLTETNPPGEFRLTLLEGDGNSRVLLTAGFLVFAGETKWAPDDDRLAIVGPASDGIHADLYILSIRDRSVQNVTGSRTRSMRSIAWASDGEGIAFIAATAEFGFEKRIFIVNADGTQLTMLDNGYEEEFDPDWNPTRDAIVFTGENEDEEALIVVDIDTGTRDVIARQARFTLSNGIWSPNGDMVAYASAIIIPRDNTIIPRYQTTKFHIYDVPSGEGWIVTDFGDDMEFSLGAMSWAPDSRHLAFVQGAGIQDDRRLTNLYILDICEGNPRLLVEDIGSGRSWRVVEE
jgi:Tol biopolymer transport system component